MLKEIKLPAGGQTTDTSIIGNWLVKEGDKVKRGDALLEIETDKATLTVESFTAGTVLAILAEEGDERSAGDVIAYIGSESDRAEVEARLAEMAGTAGAGKAPESRKAGGDEPAKDEETASSAREEDEYQPVDKSAPVRYIGGGPGADAPAAGAVAETLAAFPEMPSDIQAMPNAKLLARENRISLAEVARYTGKSILKRQDVQAYMDAGQAPSSGEAAGMPGITAGASGAVDAASSDADTRVPLTNMRRVIARRMLESAQNIPAFSVTVDVDMEQCMTLRRAVNSAKDAKKISYNDILFKCVEAAIRKYPYINASFGDGALLLHHDVNIGLAVSVEGGLVVPVVRQVNGKNISEISEINRQNIARAREGKLQPGDMSGGTITVSNLGMYPVTQFTAVINPPEACILAVGMIGEKPVLENGAWKAVHSMRITGTFDHRVVDGAYGAQFLTELKNIIENPMLALM